jgi:molecular chaperone DnaJ
MPVRIPAGVENGATLRLPLGGPGENQLAVVRVEPHRYFDRRGNDLTLRLPITLAEAALGGVVTIPTLTGAVAIRIPPGTTHGRVLRIRGRGLPAPDQPGDLLATIHIVVPTSLTAEQRIALEAFAAATDSPRKHFES